MVADCCSSGINSSSRIGSSGRRSDTCGSIDSSYDDYDGDDDDADDIIINTILKH